MDNVLPTGTDKYPIDNINMLLIDPNYGTKSTNQIKSLISIVNHKLNVYMEQNTFRHNTGTKGIIYLDMKARVNTRVIFGTNYFYNKFEFSMRKRHNYSKNVNISQFLILFDR
jgi:hypothetical protein